MKLKPYITIDKEFFIAEKSNDVFMEVEFKYDTTSWKGVIPKFLGKQGLDLTDEEFHSFIEDSYEKLNPRNRDAEWL